MKQAGENSNSLKMVFRNRPENEKIVRTTALKLYLIQNPKMKVLQELLLRHFVQD